MRKIISVIMIVAILSTLLTSVVSAATTTTKITADRIAVISDYQPDANKWENNGSADNMSRVNLASYHKCTEPCTKNHPHDLAALLHFTIPNYVAEDVEKITFNIYYESRNKSGTQTIAVSQISNEGWNSNSTYNSAKPVRTGKVVSWDTGGAGAWKGFDITNLVNADGTVNIAFNAYIEEDSTDADLRFLLTEVNNSWGDTDYTPYIEVKTKEPSTKDAVFNATTQGYAAEILDKSVDENGNFNTLTQNSWGSDAGTIISLRRTSANGTDCNIGISAFDFSSVKSFADKIVVSIYMYSGNSNMPNVYVVPDNATKLSDCSLIGELTVPQTWAWVNAEIDVTSAVKADDDGIVNIGIYVPDEKVDGNPTNMEMKDSARAYTAYGVVKKDNINSIPAKSTIDVTRKVAVGTVERTETITPIIAIYNGETLKQAIIGDSISGLNGSYSDIKISVPEYTYEANDYIKVFYWSNLTDLVPVLDSQGLE